MALEKFTSGPPRAVAKLNSIIDPIQRGIVIQTDEILVDVLPDGRVRLRLSEQAKQRIASGGKP